MIQTSKIMEPELIPGLPEDLARLCLIRIPFNHFNLTRSVCKLWKRELESELFHSTRYLSDQTRPVLALAHSAPVLSSSADNKHHSHSYALSLFDPATATWQSLPPIPGLSQGLPLFCHLAVVGRDLLVIGGWDRDTWAPTDGVFIYNLATATWRSGARMPGPRRSFFACSPSTDDVSGSGTVLVAGGHDEEKNALRSALAYDVASDEWSPLPDMARERDECKGLFLRGKFHVIGGYETEEQGRFSTSAEVFDVSTWKWGPVEEDWLETPTCPRTCSSGGGGGGRICVFRSGHVAVREEGKGWREAGEVPEDASVASVVVTWQGKVVVIGSGCHGGDQVGYVMDMAGEGKRVTWQRLELPPQLNSGHVQAACCLRI